MRLLNAATLQLELFPDPASVPDAVPYAILSHTWEIDEVTFNDIKELALSRARLGFGKSNLAKSKLRGFAKIQSACEITLRHGLAYIWIDTCCIDKSSSAELSEAINSMFRWYRHAAVCFAFLADFPNGSTVAKSLASCRWFTRGWTLQELIAPHTVIFVDKAWAPVGTKADLGLAIEAITNIDQTILDGSE